MPLFSFFKKNEGNHPELSPKEKKSLLALKAVQAQQNPSGVYDLSNCDAIILPDDTYTFCKLLGKSSLVIKQNLISDVESGGNLKDLYDIKEIDGSYNKIDKLPSSISHLENLQVLNLSHNRLKSLPQSFGLLNCLEELYLSHNKFSTVPRPICALTQLKILHINDNNITILPKELSELHSSLVELICDTDKIKYPSNISTMKTKDIMQCLCKENEIDYSEPDSLEKRPPKKCTVDTPVLMLDLDDIMLKYLKRKDEQSKQYHMAEQEHIEKEKIQIENVLMSNQQSKMQLLNDISDGDLSVEDFEALKQEKMDEKLKLEEEFKNTQDKELEAYLSSTTNKESLLSTITAQEESLQKEVTAIVAEKDREREKLFKDLVSAEKEIDNILLAVISEIKVVKSEEFSSLLVQQDAEMRNLLETYEENSANISKTAIVQQMKDSMLDEFNNVAKYFMVDDKKKAFALSLLNKEGAEEESKLREIMYEKQQLKLDLLNDLEENEKQQEAAFKLLLSQMDLKRNNILRQIAVIEYELTRLSSLELRKKQCGFQYGSNIMLNQRSTLASLLANLIEARDEREMELEDWCSELEEQRSKKLDSQDYWLHQYQRLMEMKPESIAKAEQAVEDDVIKVLSYAHAMDLLPVFANHSISFGDLLTMDEQSFLSYGISHGSYLAIQRALTTFLNEQKVCATAPSAPEIETVPAIDEASAPPVEHVYAEVECVVCLSNASCIVFLNCGHVCSCQECCVNLTSCPMCRADIISKYFLNVT